MLSFNVYSTTKKENKFKDRNRIAVTNQNPNINHYDPLLPKTIPRTRIQLHCNTSGIFMVVSNPKIMKNDKRRNRLLNENYWYAWKS